MKERSDLLVSKVADGWRLRHLSTLRSPMLLTLASAPLLMMGVSAAHAASELNVTGGARVEYHDNLSRVSDNEDSDVDRIALLDVGYLYDENAVHLDLNYQGEYHDYLHDREEDETALNGRTDLVWQLLPRTLDFVFSHQISQELSDRQGLNVSNNRELRSVTTTGIDWITNFSAVDSVVVSPRFADVRFEESDDSDSQRGSLGAAWQHRLSQVSQLSLAGNYADVKFDDGSHDYTASSLTLGFSTKLSRLSYEVAVGANEFDRDVGDKVDGFMARASLQYDSDATVWTGALVHELTDSSVGLSGEELIIDDFVADDGNFDEVDIVERSQLDLGVQHRFNAAHSAGVGIGARDDDYEDTLRDERSYFVSANYLYTLNSYWSLGVDLRVAKTKFLDDPQDLEYDETLYSAKIDYRYSQALTAQFALIREDRDASDSNLSYTDNIAMFSVNYRFF